MRLEDIFTFDNLYNVHKKCRCSKQQKSEVVRFEVNLAENLYKLREEMWLLEKIIKEQPNNVDEGLLLGNKTSL